MAFNEHLADRIRERLHEHKVSFEERRMMGGLCFMVDDKMCIGIIKEDLMARIHPDIYEDVIKEDGIKPMDFTGRPMKGYVFASPESIDREDDLDRWVKLCLEFNPMAKASKKKKKM